jgi:hypothetical protein
MSEDGFAVAKRDREKQADRMLKNVNDFVAFVEMQAENARRQYEVTLGAEQRRALTTEQALTESLEDTQAENRALRADLKHAEHAVLQLNEARRALSALVPATMRLRDVVTGDDHRPAVAEFAVEMANEAFGVVQDANWR